MYKNLIISYLRKERGRNAVLNRHANAKPTLLKENYICFFTSLGIAPFRNVIVEGERLGTRW